MSVKCKVKLKNRYKVINELGRGGMGAIYKAKDEILDINVAIKELFDSSRKSIEQFEKEAKILARLKHPNLPRVTDFFEEYNGEYLVMDYIEGEDLQEILEKSAVFLSEKKVINWITELLKTLEYIHSNGIIHRDIKPANLKLTSQGKIILVDFGIAKEGFNSMTHMGAHGFTPYIAPPEQYTGTGRTGIYSDIYAVGSTMYYLLTGTLPAESVIRMMGTELVKPSQINRSISGETEKIILKAMSIQITERYLSAEEMKNCLSCDLNSDKGNLSNNLPAGKIFKRDIRK